MSKDQVVTHIESAKRALDALWELVSAVGCRNAVVAQAVDLTAGIVDHELLTAVEAVSKTLNRPLNAG